MSSFMRFDVTELKRLYDTITTSNMEELISSTTDELEKWKEVKIKIGFVGRSGCGKSSLINALRGLQDTRRKGVNYEVVAKTGTGETTRVPTKYTYPDNPNIELWDLPGNDTANYPIDGYMETIKHQNFDCFVVCCCDRFPKSTINLARDVKESGRNFFLVRTKIDGECETQRRTLEAKWDSDEETLFLAEIRDEAIESIKEIVKADDQRIYLLSTLLVDRVRWDFPALVKDLVSKLPGEQKNAMLRQTAPLAREIIRQKCEYLRSRVEKVALLSGVSGVVPIPGASFALDARNLWAEITLYKDTLSLNEDQLRALASSQELYEKVKEKIEASDLGSLLTTQFSIQAISRLFAYFAISNIAEEVLKLIPGIGSAVGIAVSYFSIRYTLNQTLDKLEPLAIDILEMIMKYKVAHSSDWSETTSESDTN